MSKSKSIGTRAESRVVKYLKEHVVGIDSIHRRELHGKDDIGDIIFEDLGLMLEVKGGKQTDKYTKGDFCTWVCQALAEMQNPGSRASRAFLVIVEYNRSVYDAKVYEFLGDGRYNFWYLDAFVKYVNSLYLERCESDDERAD